MGFVTRNDVINMLRQYEQARRQHAWWRRLLRWIHGQFFAKKKTLADLTPEQREALRAELNQEGQADAAS